MSATVRDDQAVTIAEFDSFLDNQRDAALWELVAGHILAMTNPTDIHEKIVSNIGGPLQRTVDGSRCHVFLGVCVCSGPTMRTEWTSRGLTSLCGVAY